MKRSGIYTALLLSSVAYAQTPPAPSIRITAVRADVPQQPVVPEVLISLFHIRTKASYGRRATDRNGVVLLDLPADLVEAAYLQVTAEGKELAVYQPAAGSLPASALLTTRSLTVELVPKRSDLLQTPVQIQARLNEEQRILRENHEVRLQNASLQSDLASLKAEQEREREEYRRRWSEATGFTVDELANVVRAFARAILENPGAHSVDERALALYAQGRIDEAGQLLREDELSATDKRSRELQALRDRVTQELEKAERASAEETIRRLGRAAGLFTQAFEFQKAVDTWADCVARIDPKFADVRASALVEQGNALQELGGKGESAESAASYRDAVAAFRSALEVYTRATLPQDWAATQNNLGIALSGQAARTSGQAGVNLLIQAVIAYRRALEVHTRATLPQKWATTQSNLGAALSGQAGRASGQSAVFLLAQAVAAYRSVLEVRTRATLPQDWARTQNNLGAALTDQAGHTSGQAAVDLLAQAVAAFRSALEVCTRATFPQDWAKIQNNLGVALRDQAGRARGQAAADLLAQAVAAYRSALEVYTRATLPQDWAMTQNNLGVALSGQAWRTSGQAGVDLLAQAVAAYRSALEVNTRATLPQNWAKAQNNLGNALRDQAARASWQVAVDLLAQAVAAYRSALEVYTRATFPQDWAMTQYNLGYAFSDQAGRASGQAAVDLLAQAVAAYRSALEVRTRTTLPQDWAMTQNNLGNALRDQAGRTTGQAALDLLAQAVAAYRSALEVNTRTTLPQEWARTENNLANALAAAGDWLDAATATEGVLELYPNLEEALSRLASLYEDRLFDYDRAFPLFQKLLAMSKTAGNLENLAESLLANGRFTDCDKAWTALTIEILSPNHLPLRDAFRLACQSAAGDSTAARATAVGLASATLEPTGWGFSGTLHFLSTYAAFADHRDAWVGLFTALDKADTSAFRAALREIQASLNSR